MEESLHRILLSCTKYLEMKLKFSGHDTFHCKEQWLLKGVQLIETQGVDRFKEDEAIPELGVGKNMVRSIQHWLRAFGIVKDNELQEISHLIFKEETGLDPYLENEGTLWLLQYFLCHSDYASIFKLIFGNYFSDKATLEFSESQVLSFLQRKIKFEKEKEIRPTTLAGDFKVFIKTYVVPKKNEKSVEDDFNVPLLGLNLVSNTNRRNSAGEVIYRINKSIQPTLSPEVFIFCLLTEFTNEPAINLDDIRKTIGSYLCLSNEGLDLIIERICHDYSEFVYKDDAGVRQLQVKEVPEDFKTNILRKHYELYS